MKIAIHYRKGGFAPRWINYCDVNKIPYKLVNCYSNNIVKELQDCGALLWHPAQRDPKSLLAAKQILLALDHSGFTVFPNFYTNWHFDDKIAQKYLLECIEAPIVPSYVFFNKQEALEWVESTEFPKIWKLRGGAGSSNVKYIGSRKKAKKYIKKAFGRGFLPYHPQSKCKDLWAKYRKGKTNLKQIINALLRVLLVPYYYLTSSVEKGYAYFQDFVPNNDSDTRIIVIDGKAFALKRMNREKDFRASGSGNFRYAKEEFDERCVKIAFNLTKKLQAQCLAYDFVFDEYNNPKVLEISYGFVKTVYDPCPGYWDEELNWHEGVFDPYGWMVEMVRKGA